jgi:hypothetical protein
MITDTDLDALLAAPLPEADAGAFSVELMERIAEHEARPARIAAWIMAGLLALVTAIALILLAPLIQLSAAIAAAFVAMMLLLSFTVFRSARA